MVKGLVQEIKRQYEQQKEYFRGSPFVSNVTFGFILTATEHFIEKSFHCPCKPKWNAVYSSAFFLIPSIISFMMMLLFLKCKCNSDCCKCYKIIYSFAPVIVWLELLFLDGRYFACAKTNWNSTGYIKDRRRWCYPDPSLFGNEVGEAISSTTFRKRSSSLWFYVVSQVSMCLCGRQLCHSLL